MTHKENDENLDFADVLTCYYNGKAFTGVSVEYYSDGTLRSEIPYIDGLAEGTARDFYQDGTLRSESEYRRNEQHGVSREWYKDEKLKLEAHCEFGIATQVKMYDPTGELTDVQKLDGDSPISELIRRWREAEE